MGDLYPRKPSKYARKYILIICNVIKTFLFGYYEREMLRIVVGSLITFVVYKKKKNTYLHFKKWK